MNTLSREIAKFRTWAEIRLKEGASGAHIHADAEWECDYPDWANLYEAIEGFLRATERRKLSSAELELLLYALARDNEDERIMETLGQFPDAVIQLAQVAFGYPDSDARWQVAVLLGKEGSAKAVALLRRFLTDNTEYVQRRARIALQEAQAKQ